MKNKKKFSIVKPYYLLLCITNLIMVGVAYYLDRKIFYVVAPVVLIVTALSALKLLQNKNDLADVISVIDKTLINSQESGLVGFPIPAIIVSESNTIIWYNNN
ncbi:MAG: hypothetical protein RSE93_04005, partial [Oscillospiraceae bacterium]